MVKISYSTHGLQGDLFDLIDRFEQAGYEGVELAFEEGRFDPRLWKIEDIERIPFLQDLKTYFQGKRIRPACINTATLPLIPGRLHEPTLISLEEEGRHLRVEMIQKGIEIAKVLGAPIVCFGSGFIRWEHVLDPSVDPIELLIESLHHCLKTAQGSSVTLVLEPEPGMLIETLDQAVAIIERVGSPHLGLHLDLCHAYCSEWRYVEAIEKAMPYVRYLHLSDTKAGYNLKIIRSERSVLEDLNLDFAAYLIHFEDEKAFLLVDRNQALCFYQRPLTPSEQDLLARVAQTVRRKVEPTSLQYVDTASLLQMPKTMDYERREKEIKTFLLSMPAISYETLDQANLILHYLRGGIETGYPPVITEMIANSLTGKVHYHEVPGEGTLDFQEVFRVLGAAEFNGYAAVELYHHESMSVEALKGIYDFFGSLSQNPFPLSGLSKASYVPPK